MTTGDDRHSAEEAPGNVDELGIKPDVPGGGMTMRHDDGFEQIIGKSLTAEETAEMTASAERYARFKMLQTRVMAEHGRWQPYADEHPEALQAIVDPTIRLSDANVPENIWRLPAGWVEIVNRLHSRLVEELGDYEVLDAGQRSAGLRFCISSFNQGEACKLIAAARAESLRMCEVCGWPSAPAPLPRFETRCARHPIGRPDRVPDAISRRPGWMRRSN